MTEVGRIYITVSRTACWFGAIVQQQTQKGGIAKRKWTIAQATLVNQAETWQWSFTKLFQLGIPWDVRKLPKFVMQEEQQDLADFPDP